MKNELVVHSKPKSNISEDIRTIRTNLQFTALADSANSILVTSSNPGEGKSFISSNLAVAFAQSGKKTILVDCDMRLGRAHKIFGISNEVGLSNLLIDNGNISWKKYIVKTDIPELYVITRGTVPPNPSELLASDNTTKVIKALKEQFEYIIFDGVPVNGLPDSLVMANTVDRVVLVTAIGDTKVEELDEAKKALEKVGAKIAGVVVNRTKKTKRGKYSNYYE